MKHANSPMKRLDWQNECSKKRMRKYRDAKKTQSNVTKKRNTPKKSNVTEKRNTPGKSNVTEKPDTPGKSNVTEKPDTVCCSRVLKDKGTADHVSRGNVSP